MRPRFLCPRRKARIGMTCRRVLPKVAAGSTQTWCRPRCNDRHYYLLALGPKNNIVLDRKGTKIYSWTNLPFRAGRCDKGLSNGRAGHQNMTKFKNTSFNLVRKVAQTKMPGPSPLDALMSSRLTCVTMLFQGMQKSQSSGYTTISRASNEEKVAYLFDRGCQGMHPGCSQDRISLVIFRTTLII
jgi:hypothetical protein